MPGLWVQDINPALRLAWPAICLANHQGNHQMFEFNERVLQTRERLEDFMAEHV